MARRKHRLQRQVESRKRYEHRARNIVRGGFLIIFLLFPLSIYRVTMRPVVRSAEAMDAAQVARNLARGGGFSTNIIRPDLYNTMPRFTKPVDVSNEPLHIWLLSQLPGMRNVGLFQPPDVTVVNLSCFFYLATALLLYYMFQKLFDRATAGIAFVAYLFSPAALDVAISGTSETLAGAMLTLLFLWVYIDRNESFVVSFLTGVFMGLCYLAMYELLIILLPLAAYKIMRGGERKYRHLTAMFVGFAVAAGPWMMRNMRVSGNPIFGRPLRSVFFSSEVLKNQRELGIAGKFNLQASVFIGNILKKYSGILAMAFFLVSPLVKVDNPELRRINLFVWACLFCLLVTGSLCRGNAAIVYGFIPFAIFMGTKVFMDMLPRPGEDDRRRTGSMAVYIGLSIFPFFVAILGGGDGASMEYIMRRRLNVLKDMHGMMHSGDIVMTNTPELIAYYGEFNTLPMPKDKAQFTAWQDDFGDLRYAIVCQYGSDPYWKTMTYGRKQVPGWFISDKANIYPSGECLFVSDKVLPHSADAI